MHIAINISNGIPYATVMTSVREGKTVKKKSVVYLGRVLDEERGIYKSAERGVFSYDLRTNTFGEAPVDFVPQIRRKNARPTYIVDFGDAFLFNSLIEKFGLLPALEAIPYGNPDSFRALLLYYMLESRSNAQAEVWWEGSFARILYPNANLTTQRISSMLEALGQEDVLRAFFGAYLEHLGGDARTEANILIDSTGLPNSIRFPLTAISNHNGEISEEVRLIYVVQQGTRLPIYMRYVPGNIVDTTTLITTIKELKAMEVNTKFAILDAGYVTEKGLRQLYDDNISFITRCPTNRTIYKRLMANELSDLEKADNLAVDKEGKLFNGRQVYVKCVPVDYEGMKLYAYIGRDVAMREIERKKIVNRVVNSKKPVHKDELQSSLEELGVFVLLSTRKIRADLILSHYYVRQDVEQVFDISKNYASLLPLNVEKEETFRGHLLMTFIATVVLQMLQNKIRQSTFTLDRILARMRTQKAKVFEQTVIPAEMVKEHNDIYKLLGIKPAKEYPLKKRPKV